jgi:ATP-dependent Clp protease ATP-binding subunit ClpX
MDVTKPSELRCSFCAKLQTEVRKLIAGHNGAICDECVKVCHRIMNNDEGSGFTLPEEAPDSPKS